VKLPALLHSVSYAGFWGQARLSIEDFLDKAAALGYDGVMLTAKRPHLSILDFDGGARARLRARLERNGLHHAVIAGYNNLTADLEHGDIPHREIQIHYIVELARLANEVGASIVRIFTGYENPASTYTAQWNLIVDTLGECARRAAPYGVTLGVQNHHDIACGFESQFDLIAAVNEPNCRALFDAWAPALHGADLDAAARLLGPVTAHTTVACYTRRPRYSYDAQVINYTPRTPYVQAVPAGEGFIDNAAFLAALCASGFSGSVGYEMCSPLLDRSGKGAGSIENLDLYARRFLEFFRGLP
jgi:sugar phosphate isomerase/epimerase